MKFGDKVTGNTFKLTGEFIVSGKEGVYAQMREHIEDEDEDPVVDIEFEDKPREEIKKETVAIVPGAFKPPHKGHADMVKRYITGKGIPSKADKVIIIISKPTIKGRYLPIQETEVTATHSEKMWKNILLPSVGLGAPEVTVVQSPMASPIQAAYEYIGKNSSLDPITQRVILGASDKPDTRTGLPDWHRWQGAIETSKEEIDSEGNVIKLEILDPKAYAVECLDRSCDKPFSATDMRELVSKLLDNPDNKEAKNELSEFIPRKDIKKLLKIFRDEELEDDPEELEEMSSVGGGSMAFGVQPVVRPVRKKPKKAKKKKKQQENVDTTLIDDVMRLIMERGIML